MKKLLSLTAALLIAIGMYAQDCELTPEVEKHRLQGLAKLEIAKSKEDYESVIKEWETVVEANPNCAEMLYNIALVYDKAENYPQAIYYLNQYKKVEGTEEATKKVENLLIKIEAKKEASKEQVNRNWEKYTGNWELRATRKDGSEDTDFRGFTIFMSQDNSLKAQAISIRDFVRIYYEKNKAEKKNKNDNMGTKDSINDKFQIIPVKVEGDNIIISYRYLEKIRERTLNKKGKAINENKVQNDLNGLAEFTLHLVSPSRMEGQWFGDDSKNNTSFYFSKQDDLGTRAKIGIYTQDISVAKKENPDKTKNIITNEGAYVTGFPNISASPAKQAGIEEGDVITAINEFKVKNDKDFTVSIGKFNPGDKIEVNVIRGNTNKTFEVTLGDYSIYSDEETHNEEIVQ